MTSGEHARELLAESIKETRAKYARGEVRRGTADDLIREIVAFGTHDEVY